MHVCVCACVCVLRVSVAWRDSCVLFGMWGKSIKKLKPKSKPAQSIKIKLFLYVACVEEHRAQSSRAFRKDSSSSSNRSISNSRLRLLLAQFSRSPINQSWQIQLIRNFSSGQCVQLEICAIVFIQYTKF